MNCALKNQRNSSLYLCIFSALINNGEVMIIYFQLYLEEHFILQKKQFVSITHLQDVFNGVDESAHRGFPDRKFY